MGEQIQLNTTRTQCIGAYLAKPKGAPKGGIVVVQEIFGVNQHMRNVTDRFAEHGYVAIAPAFFDHFEAGVELGYDEAAFKRARELVGDRRCRERGRIDRIRRTHRLRRLLLGRHGRLPRGGAACDAVS